jgi:hypothetical protein
MYPCVVSGYQNWGSLGTVYIQILPNTGDMEAVMLYKYVGSHELKATCVMDKSTARRWKWLGGVAGVGYPWAGSR